MKATEARKKRRWRSYYGAEQKSLHVKMYFDVLEQLDKEASVDGTPRNQLINQACEYYVKQLDEERLEASSGKARECTHCVKFDERICTVVSTTVAEKLQHIARGLGCDSDTAAMMLLDRAVREYDSRPFSFM